MPTAFPHLKDTESVRQEAASQHGPLTDAAAFLQSHKAAQSPDVAAASLRQVDFEETAKLKEDPDLAQSKVTEALGEGYTVLDAVVRGDALSAVVVDDSTGQTTHVAVGWNDRWKSLVASGADAEANVNAQAAAAESRLSGEIAAEIGRLVEEARVEISAKVAEAGAKVREEIDKIRQERIEEIEEKREEAAAEGGDSSEGTTPPSTEAASATSRRGSARGEKE